MRHVLPFSLRSSPHSVPGRSRYLRGMLYALRRIVTPLGDLAAGTQSRRNLEVRDSLWMPRRDCAEIAYLQLGHIEA